ncbi:hypothetical protein BATDEDRAFT_85448 [Batrachochytrium dendrobatidis JAM81]|uniref:G-protein coupled receptors family 3 profile domain-containing protein n=1 Tax=Batrachochytrium dendrobatidis (strain JAM81 / FGSC 10211) TaxID=684364 RepID=F4NV81_BATDJ|nr:uncharacterized protein BATDEDRAFT_85448 [Batrachochytrium dendrobatidis JAM81]EGF84078.1 hypothetical protein BATDEDRAFT_85448 [Batrachochytrium dendrobatidis JAM81]|eukprot:XP_006676326.1 hypothetical protein BATDEDRAFT_85448 [Batrachochytrium dendrobatidis JAM81]
MVGFTLKACICIYAQLCLTAQAANPNRGNNKTSNTILFTYLTQTGVPVTDQAFAGMHMAVGEINSNASILQDVNIILNKSVIPDATIAPASVFDFGVSICTPNQPVLIGSNLQDITMELVMQACPKALAFSIIAGADALSDKTIYPKFWRYVTTWGQRIKAQAAHYVYYGWTQIGMISSIDVSFTEDICTQYFPTQGVDISASTRFSKYNPAVSQYYYTQLKDSFQFLKSSNLRVFLINAESHYLIDVMMAANRTGIWGRDYVWTTTQASIAYQQGASSRWDTPLNPQVLRGLTLLTNKKGPYLNESFIQQFMVNFKAFINYTLTNEQYLYSTLNFSQTNPAVQNYPPNTFYADPGTHTYPLSYLTESYDGAYTLAHTCEQAIVEQGVTGVELAGGLVDGNITISKIVNQIMSNPTVSEFIGFTPKGDPSVEILIMYQLLGTSFHTTIPVGVFNQISPNSDVHTFTPNTSAYFWSGDRAYSDTPAAFPPAYQDFVSSTNLITDIMLGLSGLWSVYFGLSAVLYLFIKQTVPLNFFISIGLAIIPLNAFTIIGQDKPLGCALRIWPVPLGLTIILSCILSKSAQLQAIFSLSRSTFACILTSFKGRHAIFLPLIVVIPVMLLLGVTSVMFPFVSNSVYVPDTSGYTWVCVPSTMQTSLILYIIITAIVVMSISIVVLGYLNRNLPQQFNDTHQTAASIIIILVLGALCLGQGYTTQSIQLQFYFEVVSSLVGTTVVHAFIVERPLMKYIWVAAFKRYTMFKKRNHHKSATKSRKQKSREMLENTSDLKSYQSYSTDSSDYSLIVKVDEPISKLSTKDVHIYHKLSYSVFQGYILNDSVFPRWLKVQFNVLNDPIMVVKCIPFINTNTSQYIQLSQLLEIESYKVYSNGMKNICVMRLLDNTLFIQFSSTFALQEWTNYIARCVLKKWAAQQLITMEGKAIQHAIFSRKKQAS